MRCRTRELPRTQPLDCDEYTLSARGEDLGRVEVGAGVRPGAEFEGYFHPVRAFSRYVRLFDDYDRASMWSALLESRKRGRCTAITSGGRRVLNMAVARKRADAAADWAGECLEDLGLELRDPGGGSLGPCFITIERVRIEESWWLDDPDGTPRMLEEIDAGVDVSPYRLSAFSIDNPSVRGKAERRLAGTSRRTAARGRREGAGLLAAVLAEAELWTEQLEDLWEEEEQTEVTAAELERALRGPSFDECVRLWRRAAAGNPRDTFESTLEFARSDAFTSDNARNAWIGSVQHARADGVLDGELSRYLIWRIATDAADRQAEMGGQPEPLARVFRAAGEATLATLARQGPRQLATRMAALDRRVRGMRESRREVA